MWIGIGWIDEIAYEPGKIQEIMEEHMIIFKKGTYHRPKEP